jgi:hypothetical protein
LLTLTEQVRRTIFRNGFADFINYIVSDESINRNLSKKAEQHFRFLEKTLLDDFLKFTKNNEGGDLTN